MNSDFPEFDKAYKNMLLPDDPDLVDNLAADANFSIFHNDLWNGTARRFTNLIIEECVRVCEDRARSAPMGSDEQCEAEDCANAIKKRFGVETVNDTLRNRSTYFGHDA